MHYDDFSVRFGVPRDGEHEVIVSGSSAGEARGTFRIPFSDDERRDLQERLGRFVRSSSEVRNDTGSKGEIGLAPAWSPLLDPREIGSRLFRALFADEVERRLDLSLAKVEDQGRGLRIRLCLPADREGFARLISLPWEVLYWPRRRRFLALGRELSIVRFLEIDQSPHFPRPELPLRVLAVASRAGTPPLNVEEECRDLKRACDGLSQVQVTFLPEATPNALRRMLRAGSFHLLHFMGHGAFNRATGEGALVFENKRGDPDPLPAEGLANLVRDFPSLRLVLLTACDSARLPGAEGLNVYGNIALALLAAGLPAVLAMQYRFSGEAAVLFSEAFYKCLAAGDPVEAATAEGRIAIHLGDSRSVEWATPVLFSRVPDGRLLPLEQVNPEQVNPVQQDSKLDRQTAPQRLLNKNAGNPGRVFISYAREDYSYAKKIFLELKQTSYEPWLDRECLLPGQRWQATIEQAIKESRYFLALISSRSSAKRGYVQKELRKALDLLEYIPEGDIFLIPARLDDCEPAHSALREVQWVDLFPSWEAGVKKIINTLMLSSGDAVSCG